MKDLILMVRQTSGNRSVAIVRILLGLMFLMTGLMKLLVPFLREAFSGQLLAAGIPFHALNMWLVPVSEAGIGILMLIGLLSRLWSAGIVILMAVATYVHLAVNDPSLFPLQPEAPIIPLLTIVLSISQIVTGGGRWSLDYRAGEYPRL